jgi:hypothetical protein
MAADVRLPGNGQICPSLCLLCKAGMELGRLNRRLQQPRLQVAGTRRSYFLGRDSGGTMPATR